MTRRSPRDRRPTMWLKLTVGGGLLVTAIEAALMQRRYSMFTGGFLSRDHLESPGQVGSFFLISLAVDVAVIGFMGAVIWKLASWAGLRRSAPLLAFVVPVGILVAADFTQYRLLEYLGDAFDLALMFDLVGGDIRELLAVSIEYFIAPTVLLAIIVTGLGLVVWIIERQGRRAPGAPSSWPQPNLRRATVLLVLAIVISTAARLTSEPLENSIRRKSAGQALGSLVQIVTDVDHDRFGLLRQPADPDPWDAEVFPYAVDLPGNHIDENGVGGDLPANTPIFDDGLRRVPAFRHHPNLVFIVLESFRSDLIGATFDGQPVTPVLTAVADSGQQLQRAFSHNGYTSQSRYHLFSGTMVVSLTQSTLVDDFQANGYEVAYFSGQDESFGGPTLSVGFDRADVSYDARVDQASRYSTFSTAGSLAVPHTLVRERVRDFLAHRDDSKPLFLYVNLHDTHFPYHHAQIEPIVSTAVVPRGDIVPERRADVWAMYVNAAANVDRTIGVILDDVRSALGTEPAIIVTSDHGESLFDEDFLGHGYALNDAQTRIPFIVAGLPLRMSEPFGQASLRHALWHVLEAPSGVSAPTPTEGGSVFQYLGNLRRPRQIAIVNQEGRVLYDFRTGLARLGDKSWTHPDDLSHADHTRFLDLIHRWEAMVLASERAGPSPEQD